MTVHVMEVTVIAAVARDGAIGIKGGMPFHISADLRRFKQITMGKPLVMGRRTFESLPGGALPGRRNIVVTRNAAFAADGAERAASLEEALRMCDGAPEVMILGGGEIYRQAMPLATRLELTAIDADVPDADVHFPPVGEEWAVTDQSDSATDPRSGASYRFLTLHRR